MTCNRLEGEDLLAELGGAMDRHVADCADCRARLQGYAQIANLIAAGDPTHRAPSGWKQRTLARVLAEPSAPPRRRRTAVISVLIGAAAIALLFVVWPRPQPPAPDTLTLQIFDGGGWRGDAHPGETLQVRARPSHAAYFEIRVYRGGRDLLVRCPSAGPPTCGEADGSLLVWKIPSVATYQVVLLVSQQPISTPRGSLDADVTAATAAGARADDVQTVHVH